MTEAFEILFTASFWVAAIRIASPLIFATMGELICERAGVLNLGIEGIMVAGAFSGWFTVYMGGDLWTGVFVAAMTGAMFGPACTGFSRSRWARRTLRHRHHAPGARAPFHLPILLPEGNIAATIDADSALRGTGACGHSGAGTRAVSPTPLTFLAYVTVAAVAFML